MDGEQNENILPWKILIESGVHTKFTWKYNKERWS